MVKRRNLNPSFEAGMADLLRELGEAAHRSATVPHGVKHMGLTGDSVWYRPDGSTHSVRDIDGELQGAQGRIEDAEQSLVEHGQRLDGAETTIGTVSEDLTRVETVVIPGAVADLNDAVADLNEAIDNIVVDANGAVTYQTPYEPDASTDPAPKAGDIWFDTSDNMKLHRYDGTQWVSAADERIDTIHQAQDDLEADIDRVRTSVDGKNAVTQSTSTPPSQYDGAEGDIWEIMSSMGSGGRSVSRWRWNGTVWVSNLIGDTVLGNVDAAKIGTGYLSADRIEAGSLTADKVLIGAGGNLAPWDQVSAGKGIAPHRLFTGTAGLSMDLAPADPVRGVGPHVVVNRSSTGSHTFGLQLWKSASNKIPLEANSQYSFSATVYSDTGTTVRLAMVAYSLDGAGTAGYVGTIGESPITTLSSTPVELTAIADTPANGFYVIPYLRLSGPGSVGFVAPDIRKTVGSTLIQDGAITTDKIEAGAITAESGIIESLNAGVITSGTIDAARIGANTITAEKLLVGEFIELAPSVATYAGEWELHGPAQVINLSRGYDGRGIQFLAGSDPRAFGPMRDTKPGDVWRLEAYFENYSGGTGQGRIGAYFYDASGTYITLTYAATGSNAVAGTVTVPESAAFIRLAVRLSGDASGGPITARDIHGQRQAGATLIEDGAITTDKLTVTGDMSAAIVNAMSVNTKKLVVTEEAILNHATLIGDTVVDDINVQGKLIGTDGVFTGTVDFANINVTGEVLADKISGEYLYGTVVEGGQFVTQGTGGESVAISSSAFNGNPGLAVTGPWTTDYAKQPGIGPQYGGVAISGGRDSDGFESALEATPYQVALQARGPLNTNPGETVDTSDLTIRRDDILMRAGGATADVVKLVRVSDDGVRLSSRSGVASGTEIIADDGQASLGFDAAGASRSLVVNSTGVWVKTWRSGSLEEWNLELTANDSGWISLPLDSAVTSSGSPAYRIKNNVVYFRGTLTLSGANWPSGWTTLATITDAAHRPSFTIQRAGASHVTPNIVLQVLTSGVVEMYLPQSVAGSTTIQLSPMFYPIG